VVCELVCNRRCRQYRGMHGLVVSVFGSASGDIDVRIGIHAVIAGLGVPRTEQKLGHACIGQKLCCGGIAPFEMADGASAL
jgi:hypothetical protein